MPNEYGSACWELAQEVLTDYHVSTEQIDSLSDAIKEAIDDWFDRNPNLEGMTDDDS